MQELALAPQYTYERHRPEATDLYKVVLENLETFLALVQDECGRPPWGISYVKGADN